MTPHRKAKRAIPSAPHFLLLILLLTPPLSPPPLAAQSQKLTTAHFDFLPRGSVDLAAMRNLAESAESVLARVEEFVGRQTANDLRIRCHVYPSLEAKGLATGYTSASHAFGARNEIVASTELGFEGALEQQVAGLVLRRLLGRPKTESLEIGLSVYLAGNWRDEGGVYWAARMAPLFDSHDFHTLFDNRNFHKESYLVMEPMSASFISFVVDAFGKEALLSGYAEWVPTTGEIASLQTGWREHIDGLRRSIVAAAGSARTIPGFQRGFCHAHEGYEVHNGYISKKSDAALRKLASLGTNAVSITPFTFMRNPRRPTRLPFSHGTGAENDESVIHAAQTAQSLGMTVMLKPHVWLNTGWPGEVEMESEAAWNEFFTHYRRWIRHYALMAEMYDIEILCVGVELCKTTVGHEARWIELFNTLRELYKGKLTYAANWGTEFENVSFWGHLDYVGVNCYYPLSEEKDPSDEALSAGVNAALERIEQVAKRYSTPVVITEVGFTSAKTPWLAPYERNRGSVVDGDAQARCYEAFFGALAGRSQYAGIYWWKWPSFLEYGGPSHTGFTPNGKAAESIVKRWFTRM